MDESGCGGFALGSRHSAVCGCLWVLWSWSETMDSVCAHGSFSLPSLIFCLHRIDDPANAFEKREVGK